MQLDNEQQKEVILAAINATQWQGQVVELVAAVKLALQQAEVALDATAPTAAPS